MNFILRLRQALAASGRTRTPWYQDIADGFMTKPVKLGPRAVGWPSHEVVAIVAARVAGRTKAQLRELVQQLHDERIAAAQGRATVGAMVRDAA